eukprot:XP_020397348.1 glycine-rich cell wall structural protein 2-like [Zea mays]
MGGLPFPHACELELELQWQHRRLVDYSDTINDENVEASKRMRSPASEFTRMVKSPPSDTRGNIRSSSVDFGSNNSVQNLHAYADRAGARSGQTLGSGRGEAGARRADGSRLGLLGGAGSCHAGGWGAQRAAVGWVAATEHGGKSGATGLLACESPVAAWRGRDRGGAGRVARVRRQRRSLERAGEARGVGSGSPGGAWRRGRGYGSGGPGGGWPGRGSDGCRGSWARIRQPKRRPAVGKERGEEEPAAGGWEGGKT